MHAVHARSAFTGMYILSKSCIIAQKSIFFPADDDELDEKVALALLCQLLTKKSAADPLLYIYEE